MGVVADCHSAGRVWQLVFSICASCGGRRLAQLSLKLNVVCWLKGTTDVYEQRTWLPWHWMPVRQCASITLPALLSLESRLSDVVPLTQFLLRAANSPFASTAGCKQKGATCTDCKTIIRHWSIGDYLSAIIRHPSPRLVCNAWTEKCVDCSRLWKCLYIYIYICLIN